MTSALIGLIGALVGAVISAGVAYTTSNHSRRTDLYVAVFKQQFDAAMKLTTEAEYLRRGLKDYQQESEKDKPSFKERWLRTARELEFHAHLLQWVLGEDVERCALALVEVCKASMEEQRTIPDQEVNDKYVALGNAVHKQTYLPEMKNFFAKKSK